MRASRLLNIQMLLETRGRMSAQAMAQILEVSIRTLYRDVDQLSAAGVPIFAERGRAGGFALLEGWKTALTGFTASEAKAVFMSGLAVPAAQLGLGQAVADAQLKLMTALPLHQRDDAQRFQTRFHLDPVDWYREAESVPLLLTVAAAVWQDKQLALHYESWKQETERKVSPLGLVLKAGSWYLIAARNDKPLTYRISSIRSATMLDEKSQRLTKFDLAAYWDQSIKRFEADLYQSQAVVLASVKGINYLRYLSAAVAKAVGASHLSAKRKDGRVKLSIPIENIEHASNQLLTLAPDVQVLEPAALRAAIRKRLIEIKACYGV